MAIELINAILPPFEHFMAWGYWIGFFAALLETTIGIGLILPGSTIVLLLGAMSARGYLHVGDLIGFAVFGAIIGDNINYHIGKKYGARWLENGFWLLTPVHIKKAKDFMDNHGAKSIFIGRFIPSVKELVPFIAGSIHMDFKTFMLWNLLGAIGWGCEWVLAGYIFAQSLNLAEMWLSRAGLFFLFMLTAGGVFTIFRWLIVRNEKPLQVFFSGLGQSVQTMVTKNKAMVSLQQKYPGLFSFLRARFDITVFSGLTLSLMIPVFVYVSALFSGGVEDLLTLDSIIAADIRIANLFTVFRTERLTHILTWITLLGKSEVILAFLLVSITWLWVWKKTHFIGPLILSVAGGMAFTYLGKLAFHRPRPAMAVYAEPSFSFPSGHATIAVAFYGFAVYFLIRTASGWKRKVNLLFIGLALIAAIGFSRVYLGVHYISDVWSGYLLGAMWLMIAISFCGWLEHHYKWQPSRPKGMVAGPATVLLMLLAVVFYLVFSMTYHPTLAAVPAAKTIVVSNSMAVFTNNQMKYTETIIGNRQEPINVVFLAKNDNHLVAALERAGWRLTDKADLPSFIRAVKALILNISHPQAPIAPSFWNARTQDMGFAKIVGSNWLHNARHVKIWRSNGLLTNKRIVYVGMVNANDGFKWAIIPKINPDLDTQRERLYQDLEGNGKISDFRKEQLISPHIGKNFAGDPFFSDGQVYIISVQ